MHRDYQMIGLCQTAIVEFPTTINEAANVGGNKWDFLTLICLSAGDITNIVFRYPHPLTSVLPTVSGVPGVVIYGVRTCDIGVGQWQVIFHKS